jgi:hypothetical protein
MPDPTTTPLETAREALARVHEIAEQLDAIDPLEAAALGTDQRAATMQKAYLRLANTAALTSIAESLAAMLEDFRKEAGEIGEIGKEAELGRVVETLDGFHDRLTALETDLSQLASKIYTGGGGA